MKWRKLLWGLLVLPALASAHHGDKDAQGLRNVTVLIVRHAEKADPGNGLSARGEQRAAAYASYFDPLRLDGETLQPQRLIATSDSKARCDFSRGPGKYIERRASRPKSQWWTQSDSCRRSKRP